MVLTKYYKEEERNDGMKKLRLPKQPEPEKIPGNQMRFFSFSSAIFASS